MSIQKGEGGREIKTKSQKITIYQLKSALSFPTKGEKL
jgi:hypothetical protein